MLSLSIDSFLLSITIFFSTLLVCPLTASLIAFSSIISLSFLLPFLPKTLPFFQSPFSYLVFITLFLAYQLRFVNLFPFFPEMLVSFTLFVSFVPGGLPFTASLSYPPYFYVQFLSSFHSLSCPTWSSHRPQLTLAPVPSRLTPC